MIKEIFTSFIYTDKLDVDNNSLTAKCYELEENNSTVLASNEGGWQSPTIIDNTGFEHLIQEIEERCNQLHHQLGFATHLKQEIYFWVNINRENNYNISHMHPGAFFSGVYYIKAEPYAGAISFMNPVMQHPYVINPGMTAYPTTFNSASYTESPEPGKLVIFPSWLLHYVQPNKSGSDRISLAFNSRLVDRT